MIEPHNSLVQFIKHLFFFLKMLRVIISSIGIVKTYTYYFLNYQNSRSTFISLARLLLRNEYFVQQSIRHLDNFSAKVAK